LRRYLMPVLGLASLAMFAGIKPAASDCRSQNTACIKDATSPIDSVACGSLYRTCATNQAIAAQQSAKQGQNQRAAQPPPLPPASAAGIRPAHK
jgi:hypothetical protein